MGEGPEGKKRTLRVVEGGLAGLPKGVSPDDKFVFSHFESAEEPSPLDIAARTVEGFTGNVEHARATSKHAVPEDMNALQSMILEIHRHPGAYSPDVAFALSEAFLEKLRGQLGLTED